ncbi:TIGR01777 family oxidoreductase [Undibacterium fentianense]|uniref:TIGR01777 family oxidoreductase n=1 Tax=Undibacterium fentianense TaxID=2828728 RepID=A0A941E328_9BURK|nr:TIGR01777 family oxidoreductase [Undibacterium fentianense]MBR7800096.1 TIGR01777 family oxidoreductase [Undibacterium fentianense]
MEILITGGTGQIGRRLCAALMARGDHLTVLSRQSTSQVQRLCGSTVSHMQRLDEWRPEKYFDAVINLAGEPIIDAAWTAQRRQQIRESRIGLTQALLKKMAEATRAPTILLSGSAIGYYGLVAEKELAEDAPAAEDFSAQLCRDWEQVANQATAFGVRVVLLRTGLVLDPLGGILKKMRLPFQMGVGCRLGNGQQWMSWIHHQDYLRALLFLLDSKDAHGAFNMTAPTPVRNSEFTQALAASLHRPVWLVAPTPILRMVMGERADLLLGGQKVLPRALIQHEFKFAFADLPAALQDMLGP